MIPGMIFFCNNYNVALYQINMMFLVSQEITNVPFKIQSILTVVHIIFCYVFIK